MPRCQKVLDTFSGRTALAPRSAASSTSSSLPLDEPSVWTPRAPALLELNFVGTHPALDLGAGLCLLRRPASPARLWSLVARVKGRRARSRRDSAGSAATLRAAAREAGDRSHRRKGRAAPAVAVGSWPRRPRGSRQLAGLYRRLWPECATRFDPTYEPAASRLPAENADPHPRRAEVGALLRRLEAAAPASPMTAVQRAPTARTVVPRARARLRATGSVDTPGPSGTARDGRWRSRKTPTRIRSRGSGVPDRRGPRPDPIGGELEPRRIALVVPGQR